MLRPTLESCLAETITGRRQAVCVADPAVAGLLVAIPSMVGYNWLVHNLRVFTVELDSFAQELASCMETEFLKDE